MISLQETLDRCGALELPNVRVVQTYPLFLDSDTVLTGKPGNELWGPQIITGWPRTYTVSGVVTPIYSASHFLPNAGFRTVVGDSRCYLRGQGAGWDLGPVRTNGTLAGWESVTLLQIDLKVTRNDPAVTSWSVPTFVAGIQASRERGATGYAPHPSPWILWWSGNTLTLSIATQSAATPSGSVTRHFRIDGADHTNPQLNLSVRVDFLAGTVTADNQAGTSYTIGLADAGADWGPGHKLTENYLWPFSLGRLDPYLSSSGYWGNREPWPDLTVSQCTVTARTPETGDYTLALSGGAISPYPGAATLPVFRTSQAQHLMVCRYRETDYGSQGNIRIEGVKLSLGAFTPAVSAGWVQGGLFLDDCYIVGGSRAVGSSHRGVNYPITIRGCKLWSQGDTNLFIHRCGWLKVSDTELNYGGRRAGVLTGCNGQLANIFIAPPGPPAARVVFEQRGGVISYHHVGANYEYQPGPSAFVRLTPESWDQPWFVSGVRLREAYGNGLNNLSVPAVSIDDRWPGYTSETVVDVDNVWPAGRVVSGPGASDPTVKVVVQHEANGVNG